MLARITSRGRITIPKVAREAVRLQPGELVIVEVVGDRPTLRRVVDDGDLDLVGFEAFLHEWASPEDKAAWKDL